MSTEQSAYECLKRELEERRHKRAELYAPRRPMDQLPDEFRVTETNPKPPLIHFAFPINGTELYQYAKKHSLTRFLPCAPRIRSPVTLITATEHLSKHVEYTLELGWPLEITADCPLILVLYTNYTMEDEMLIDEDEEDVIKMVQEALGLDTSIRPKWYFDAQDSWKPGSQDVDTD